MRGLEGLLEMQTTQKNRLTAGSNSQEVTDSIQAVLAFVGQEDAAIKAQITEHIDTHPDLKNKCDLITSIPGVAHTLAAASLAELGR